MFCDWMMFQSTHPQRVRLGWLWLYEQAFRFNPRTHKGCDLQGDGEPLSRKVSIHAPTKGATALNIGLDMSKVFQSTHPQRVRHFVDSVYYSYSSFNPRTHKGCDTSVAQLHDSSECFNPRTHKGCDSNLYPKIL